MLKRLRRSQWGWQQKRWISVLGISESEIINSFVTYRKQHFPSSRFHFLLFFDFPPFTTYADMCTLTRNVVVVVFIENLEESSYQLTPFLLSEEASGM